MSRQACLRVVILIVVAFIVPQALAQPAKPTDSQGKERKVKPEPDSAFLDWARDVDPIIAASELQAWKKLTTNDEREKFIEDFWRRRDPDPDTQENEYRESYYERIAYVNEHFSSGIPGYKSDRGRVYLKFGKPDEVESHPSGGAYQREPWEGNGSTSTYPFERWFYRNIPGRPGAEIEFVDPTGTGEYRIAQNPFQKDALLNVPGAGLTMDGRDKADYSALANGIGNPLSYREQDSPFVWAELMRILNAPLPMPKNDPFGGNLISSPRLEDNPLNFETSFGFFKLDDNRVITTITLQTANKELSFRDSGGLLVANMNVTGSVVNASGRRVNFFEDALTTTATAQELTETKDRKSAYQKIVILPPGVYKVDLLVRDTRTGAGGFRQKGFTVPKFGSSLATSSLVLASVLKQVKDEGSAGQFMIGDQKVIPNTSGSFRRGAAVGVYLEIYNAGIDQTTLRPAVDAEYVLVQDGQEIGRQLETWRGAKMNRDRLTLSRLIDSSQLAAGEYRIEVRVRDHVSGQALIQAASFVVEK